MPPGYWAFLTLADFCQYGTMGNTGQFTEPTTRYNTTIHKEVQ